VVKATNFAAMCWQSGALTPLPQRTTFALARNAWAISSAPFAINSAHFAAVCCLLQRFAVDAPLLSENTQQSLPCTGLFSLDARTAHRSEPHRLDVLRQIGFHRTVRDELGAIVVRPHRCQELHVAGAHFSCDLAPRNQISDSILFVSNDRPG
jgi:hypothetical protein